VGLIPGRANRQAGLFEVSVFEFFLQPLQTANLLVGKGALRPQIDSAVAEGVGEAESGLSSQIRGDVLPGQDLLCGQFAGAAPIAQRRLLNSSREPFDIEPHEDRAKLLKGLGAGRWHGLRRNRSRRR